MPQPPIVVLEPALLGPHPSLDDRVDRLEMAGIGRQGQVDRVLVGRHVIGREAKVILDVAVAADGLGQVVALEFVEDHRRTVCRGHWRARSTGPGAACP